MDLPSTVMSPVWVVLSAMSGSGRAWPSSSKPGSPLSSSNRSEFGRIAVSTLGFAERWVAMALWSCFSIPRPYRGRVGWEGQQRETLRSEKPVRTGVSGVSPGQRNPQYRAHNPKVAGSNPAPATKRTLGTPTYPRGYLASRPSRGHRHQPCAKNQLLAHWLRSSTRPE
jgi:hypothetical protein